MNKSQIKDKERWDKIFSRLVELNPSLDEPREYPLRAFRLKKVLVANRGEIAKRFFFALHEEGIPSVAVITDPDIGQSWYDFAGEVVHIGNAANYSNGDVIIAAAVLSGANAIYPGYGFLSESPSFVRRINEAADYFNRELIFMGPDADVMESIGDKVRARMLARAHGVSLFEGADNVSSISEGLEAARRTGYPVMVKLSAGGGGRGIIPCYNDEDLIKAVNDAQRIGRILFDDERFFIEKLVERPIHIEVQIFNGDAIGLRKCAVQRRHQKIIEESAQTLVDDSTALSMLAQAQIIAKISGYANGCGAGTVEYLFDPETDSFGFLEVNTRLQVEYAVTEQSLGIDLVKWQIALFDGREKEIPLDAALRSRLRPPAHAIECRVYAEDPADGYRPAPGLITEVDLPTFNGVRCDFGFAAQDRVASAYDALIGKVIAYGSTRDECIIRLERALQEIYVRGLHTNIKQLLAIVRHAEFRCGQYNNKILDEFPELCLPSVDDTDARENQLAVRSTVALGTLTEYIRLIRSKSNVFAQNLSLDASYRRHGAELLPYRFTVEYNRVVYDVSVYSVSLEKHYILMNGEFVGDVYLISSNISRGEYIFRFGNGSYRLRVDKRTKYFSFRIKDGANKVNYYRLSVSPAGEGSRADPLGMVRSPFQCTFVALGDDNEDPTKKIHPGSLVRKGDLLIVISSMKMETQIFAPTDGRIDYLIEDGNMSRLVLGTTIDGIIVGKGIQEGDVLAIVKPVDALRSLEKKFGGRETSVSEKNKEAISTDDSYAVIEKMFLKDPKKFMPFMLESLHGGIGGLIQRPDYLSAMLHLLDKLDDAAWAEVLTPQIEVGLCNVISFYYDVLELFSPIVRDDGLSFQEELNYYVRNYKNYDYKPEPVFKDLMLSVFENYGVKEFKPSLEGDNNMNSVVFYSLVNAYFICSENKAFIVKLIRILAASRNALETTARLLESIIAHEQSEPDDSIAKLAGKILVSKFADANISLPDGGKSFIGLNAETFANTAMGLSADFAAEVLADARISLGTQTSISLDDVPHGALADKINVLSKKHRLRELYSPYEDVFVYSIFSEDSGEGRYIVFALAKDIEDTAPTDIPYSLINGESLKKVLEKACQILSLYNILSRRKKNRIEIIAADSPLKSDSVSNSIGSLNFNLLLSMSSIAAKYMTASDADTILFYFDVLGREDERLSKVYKLQRKDARFDLDLLAESDPRNPYNSSDIYSMKKWPVEIWAAETFDNGESEELLINTVDYNMPQTEPIAAKIFKGKLNGITVCFYMKDSRIHGGATGDLEGLKYAAAVYIAYRNGWPLYVWNDGAGANARQGVISLNRACEGFMMNAISSNLQPNEFLQYINACPDSRLAELFSAVDKQFFGGERLIRKRENFFFMTAVGVGSSAGLDVYGSSQSAVQIMLDDEQSYRTLTGAAIIRMATGEELSNYDIGGARVMSKWAGIVDLVAGGKYELISDIRSINDMFAFEENLPAIKRIAPPAAGIREAGLFSEADVRDNVDEGKFISFKQDYYGSGSLVAGFAKLGGRRAVILGARGKEGLHSYQAATRVHDVLRTGMRFGAPAIFVFSSRWHSHTDFYDGAGVRARIDFLRVLASYPSLKICIVTDIKGFRSLEILSHSDIIIFVSADSKPAELEFIERTAAFTAASISDAFDLARKLISLLYPLRREPKPAVGTPVVPDDNVTPYDMVTSVIKQITDNGEFLEFFAGMNASPNRPNFITGLSAFNGDTIAVIADQPLVLGGGVDAPNAERFRFFVEFANKFHLPILMLSNSSGFIPGTKQERIRIQAVGAEALDVNILSKVPVVSVVLNQSFGGRQAQAFGRYLRPGIFAMARENAVMAVLGHQATFDLLKGRERNALVASGKLQEADAMQKQFIEERQKLALAKNDALKSGAVDIVIDDITKLREKITEGFLQAKELCEKAFGEKKD